MRLRKAWTWAGRLRPRGRVDDLGDLLIERARDARTSALDGRERATTIGLCLVFVGGTGLLNLLHGSTRVVDVVLVVALLAAYAVASRVEFEIGGGSAVPTQVVFVPALVLLPPGLLPVVVAGGLLLGEAAALARGDRHLQRVLMLLASSNFALGPAVVVAVTGEPALTWRHAWVYALALVSGSLVDASNALAHQWLSVGVRPSLQLRLMGEVYVVDAALAPIGFVAAAAAADEPFTVLAVVPFVGILAWFAGERRRRIDNALELGRAYRGTAFLLGDVVEADDAYTGSHSREVVELALGCADVMRLDPSQRQRVEFAALLHDVGKIRVPSAIINKPGPLDAEEKAIMDRHTLEGEAMLEKVGGLLGEVGVIVRSCHERWDGKGYPDGLIADEAPLEARIVAACDAFNAMTTDRPYRKALSLEDAVAELRRNAGTQFDPLVVKALLGVIATFEASPRPALAEAA